MRHAKAFLLQLAIATAVAPVDELNLRLLSARDIESVIEQTAGHRKAIPLPARRPDRQSPGSSGTSAPVRFDMEPIETNERLRWGRNVDEPPVGLQVQMKIELN